MTFFEGFSLRPPPSSLILPDKRHRRESFHPCATQQLQQQRLGLVVLVVGKHDVIGFLRKQSVVTCCTRCGFKAVATHHGDTDHPQGYAAGTACRTAKCCPAAGIRADLMIDMKRGKNESPAFGDAG